MSYKFKIGDLVQLKSGGPAMTVSSLPSEYSEDYTCEWFKGATAEHWQFSEGVLKEYVPLKK